jgi:hypothetical protein
LICVLSSEQAQRPWLTVAMMRRACWVVGLPVESVVLTELEVKIV